MHINFLYSLSGLIVGVLVGLTGVGGGSLMTPILVLLFGVHPATAVGTDLLYAAITKSVGTMVHSAKQSIDWKIVGFLALGSVPASVATIYFVKTFGHTEALAHTMRIVLGYALFVTSALLVLRGYLIELMASHPVKTTKNQRSLTVLTGVVLGVLVSLTSVGAGALGVTALIMIYPALKTIRVVGSDIAHAVPLTFIAGMGYFFIGDVDVNLLASLLIGSIPGIIIGSIIAPSFPDKVLRFMLAGVLCLVGYKLIH
jgi:hypothetical protein